MQKKKRMARRVEVMGLLCRKTKFVRKEIDDLLNPRKFKQIIKRRARKLSSKLIRSSKRFPRLRSIKIPAETWTSSLNPRR